MLYSQLSVLLHLSFQTACRHSSAYDANFSSFSDRLEAVKKRKMRCAGLILREDLSNYYCYVYIMRNYVDLFDCLAVMVASGAACFLHELLMYIGKENHLSYGCLQLYNFVQGTVFATIISIDLVL